MHDDIRSAFRTTMALLAQKERASSLAALAGLLAEIEEMFRKEENILFPMTLELLTAEDWNRCRLGDDEVGYAFGVTPGTEWTAGPIRSPAPAGATALLSLSTGSSPRRWSTPYSAICPWTSVLWARTTGWPTIPMAKAASSPAAPPSSAGRSKTATPPKSVHMVTEILEAFKSGKRDKAEFWLDLGGQVYPHPVPGPPGRPRQVPGLP